MILAHNIHKSFNGRQILSGINIEFKPGEISCLIGPSGCGKTTLLKTISLVEYPDKGSLLIDDKKFNFPLKSKPVLNGLYPNLTIVFQQFQLWKHLQVKENLLLPIKSSFKEREQLFTELVETLNLTNLLNNYPYQISVGQKQRVAFARAVLTKPRYLLLDEVTSSLDLEHIKRMMQLINKIKSEGTSVILTTHLIGFAKSMSDKVYFIDKGNIIESGSSEILTSPLSERLKQFLAIAE